MRAHVIALLSAATCVACAPSRAAPPEAPLVTASSSGGATSTPPVTAERRDRTVTTRETCVLAGDCDADLAQLAHATAPDDVHHRADLLGQLCDAGNVRYCREAAEAGLLDRTVPINTAIARRRANMACNATHEVVDCLAAAAVPTVAANERRARGLPPDPSDGETGATIAVQTAPSGPPRVVAVTPSSPAPPVAEHPLDPRDLAPHCADAYARCQGADASACVSAALCLVTGQGAPLDQARAAGLYRRGCDGGAAAGCTELGIMCMQGEGIAQDVGAARDAYGRGCSGGDPRGCSELGVMALNGEGGPVDVPLGLRLLGRACDAGHTHACAVLGLATVRRAQTADDRARGEALIRQACQQRDASACTMLRVAP